MKNKNKRYKLRNIIEALTPQRWDDEALATQIFHAHKLKASLLSRYRGAPSSLQFACKGRKDVYPQLGKPLHTYLTKQNRLYIKLTNKIIIITKLYNYINLTFADFHFALNIMKWIRKWLWKTVFRHSLVCYKNKMNKN